MATLPGFLRPSPSRPSVVETVEVQRPVVASMEEDDDGAEDEVRNGAVPPDAVAYHSGDENCGRCEYYGANGKCSWLKITVQPKDHCTLFEYTERGASDMEPEEAYEAYEEEEAA